MILPAPGRVAARAMALSALVTRAYLDEAGADAHVEQLRKEIVGFLRELDCEDALLEPERKLLARPVGRLSAREQADASWLCEGLAVIAWALGRGELPDPDSQIDPRSVVESLGFLRPAGMSLRTMPTLRPSEELAVARARLALVRDRLLAFAADSRPADLEALARETELGPRVLAGVPLVEGDLRIDGRSLRDCDEARVREALEAAQERAKAIEWLCGGTPYGYSPIRAG